jgi:hypothetical protein
MSRTRGEEAVAFRLTCKSWSFIPRKVKDSSLNLALCIIMKLLGKLRWRGSTYSDYWGWEQSCQGLRLVIDLVRITADIAALLAVLSM